MSAPLGAAMSALRESRLSVRDGYTLWAGTYDTETAVSILEDAAVRALTPPLEGKALLDAACGTARRMRALGGFAVGADLVYDMLASGSRVGGAVHRLVNADVRALPFAPHSFEVVWCRLALGHLSDIEPAYAELARVSAAGTAIIVTDFHPAAARAGHGRSFRDEAGVRRVIEHYVYELEEHERAAARAGLRLTNSIEAAVGPEVRSFYERAGAHEAYEAQLGLPLVAALQFAA